MIRVFELQADGTQRLVWVQVGDAAVFAWIRQTPDGSLVREFIPTVISS